MAEKQIEQEREIAAPVSEVYAVWSHFERFPEFIDEVKEVRRTGDRQSVWSVQAAGKEQEWKAEVTEEQPDRFIAWRSTGGMPHQGRVDFRNRGDNRTGVHIRIDMDPQDTTTKMGQALGAVDKVVKSALDDFCEFVESMPRAERVGGRATGTVGGARGAARGASPDAGPNVPPRRQETHPSPRSRR